MNRTKTLIAILAGLLSLSACTPQQIAAAVASARATTQARPRQTIFISMNYSAPFDARPGDTVNIIMEPDATDPQGFCDVRGGSLWMNPFTQILICENVDF